jgi:hypothetical protein
MQWSVAQFLVRIIPISIPYYTSQISFQFSTVADYRSYLGMLRAVNNNSKQLWTSTCRPDMSLVTHGISVSSSTGRYFFFSVTNSKYPSAEPGLHQHVSYTTAITPTFPEEFLQGNKFIVPVPLSLHSDGPRAGRSGFDSGHGKIFLFSTASIPYLWPTQPPD